MKELSIFELVEGKEYEHYLWQGNKFKRQGNKIYWYGVSKKWNEDIYFERTGYTEVQPEPKCCLCGETKNLTLVIHGKFQGKLMTEEKWDTLHENKIYKCQKCIDAEKPKLVKWYKYKFVIVTGKEFIERTYYDTIPFLSQQFTKSILLEESIIEAPETATIKEVYEMFKKMEAEK